MLILVVVIQDSCSKLDLEFILTTSAGHLIP